MANLHLETCPECGAEARDGKTCQAVFDECLVREFTDPGYGAVHHLTVTAYMLQHSSKLSLQGWLNMRELLRKFLVEGKSPQEMRVINRDVVDSGKRKWKIRSADGQPKISRTRWSGTILEVNLGDPGTYCADVITWARCVLSDSENTTW